MQKIKLVLDRDYAIGAVDERIYSNFVEHLGRCVYGGIYEKGHPTSDEAGFRGDVKELVKKLNVPMIRYPGGNFVSGFCWEDSVGRDRPRRLDLAWLTTETNEVGLHEFYDWAREVGSQVMYAVNLGTGTPQAAKDVVEYCNHPGGSKYADMRIANGKKEPMGIRTFCLGNEMDGPWQMGQKTAYEYGRVASEAAKMMKWVDPAIELVACGSSSSQMPTFGEWELTMLSECYDNVDYVSLHRYYGNPDHNTEDFLASSMDLDEFIKIVASICDAVKGKKRSKKRLYLSFDEWNVWYHSLGQDEEIKRQRRWEPALPLLEDVYTFEDALLVGLMIITFLKNADRVKIACMAQLVNVIAPIMTRNGGPAWTQTTFWPLMQASSMGRGISLLPILSSPKADTKHYNDVPMVDAAATMDEQGNVTVFAVNRSLEEDAELLMDLRSFDKFAAAAHSVLHHEDLKAVNTEANPNNVRPKAVPIPVPGDGIDAVCLGKASWNVIQLKR